MWLYYIVLIFDRNVKYYYNELADATNCPNRQGGPPRTSVPTISRTNDVRPYKMRCVEGAAPYIGLCGGEGFVSISAGGRRDPPLRLTTKECCRGGGSIPARLFNQSETPQLFTVH